MRNSKRETSRERAEDILRKGEYGILSTSGKDSAPYGVPLSYSYLNEAIYFHCALKVGHKYENILNNPMVSFCVVGKTEVLPSKFSTIYESAIAFGKAEEVEGEEKIEALKSLLVKYSPDHMDSGMKYIERAAEATGVIKIVIERLTGKARD